MSSSFPSIADIRREYRANILSEDSVFANPFGQFELWLNQALHSDLLEPTAMFLATTTQNAAISLRTVLLKAYDENGFVFYTNYESRKGRQIAENNQVALLFYWDVLERQVRIEGTATRLPDPQSDDYFNSRPKESRIGAIASPQSEVLPSREVLENRVNGLSEQYAHTDQIPRPAYWGGYIVKPNLFEFWQGRPSRLHDRIQYARLSETENTWAIERLAP
jgi:pyridoxamine 5'-phosphate oxidase